MTGVIRGMPNWKAVGPDPLPAELLKLDRPEIIRCFHNLLVNVWRTEEVFHKRNYRSDCNNYRGISLVAHSCRVLLKMVVYRLSNYCEARDTPRRAVRLSPSALDSRHAVRRAQIARP